MRDPTDLIEQEADTEAQAAEAQAQRDQQAEDIQWLMRSEQGRRIAWRLLERTQVHRTPFAGHDATTNFNCGERNVGQWFLDEVCTHSPESYLQLLKEHWNK